MNIAADAPKRPALALQLKTCSKCDTTKPIDQFHRNPKTADGFYGHCKDCCAAYQRIYRKENQEKLKQNKREYAQKNRDMVLAKKRTYAAANRKKESERAIQWQKDNPDKVIARSRLRRFRERANGGEVTELEWQWVCKLFDYKCACCGKKRKLEMDHVVPVAVGGSGSIKNLQPLCRSCNASKCNKHIDYRPDYIKQLIEKGGAL